MRSILILLLLPGAALAGDWPAWRGSNGLGVTTETKLPLRWTATENIHWKIPLPGPGNSTPITWRGKLYLTQATDAGRSRHTLCLDRRDGKQLWKRTVTYGKRERTHRDNPPCSASPVTDGERVIVWHGSAGVFCYDLDGKELWRRDLGAFDHIWGNASSPVIEGDLCIINCGPGPRSFVVALDRKTGKTVWQVDIPGGLADGGGRRWTGSWSTPVVIDEPALKRRAVLISRPDVLLALAPGSGKELWRCAGLSKLIYTSPIAGDGVVVAMSGYRGPAIAVRAGGAGDVTEKRRLWRHARTGQRIGSGVVKDGLVFFVEDSGHAECIELATGKRVWREKICARSWVNVLLAGDRVYAVDDRGRISVFGASRKFRSLATNELGKGEKTRASIAPSNGQLFIRTYRHLWCIGPPAKSGAKKKPYYE